ncbi:MAG: TonB-dependent receptor plug domain-containing protein [Rhodospirillaceae bacterium]
MSGASDFNRSRRSIHRTSVSVVALLCAISATGGLDPAWAQEPQGANLEEIVVTGTRVIRDGYEAPTPLTVMSAEDLQKAAPANIADFVNRMPALLAQSTPQSNRTSVTSGGGGQNILSLRTLGTTRTLALLDGKRSVGAGPTNEVDVNSFPQGLISRVDVVTGGASAVYGSDALAGVVNFILDRTFTGVKGDVQGGITTYGDNESGKISLTAGTPFANARGHLLLSGEYVYISGILDHPRDWAMLGWRVMNNPAYGTGPGQTTSVPERLWLDKVVSSNMTPGGIISAGPLKGTAFGPGGIPYPFNYGTITRDPWTHGSTDWRANDVTATTVTLNPKQKRRNVYARFSYDVSDNLQAFAEISWAYNRAYSIAAAHFNQGNLTVRSDNAFIPAEIRSQMTTLGLTQLVMGTMSADLYPITAGPVERTTNRYVAGLEGSFGAFDQDWTWEAYYQKGKTRRSYYFHDRVIGNYLRAIDAVRDPATNNIVCRAALQGGAGSAGCVPFNIFGIGVNGPAAIDYVTHWFYNYETYTQDVMSATVSGNAFSTWAGPVSLAFGVEHRKEGGGGTQDELAAANQAAVGNAAPTIGSYTVTEGFIETVVPLASGESWADSFDISGAVRFTDYSITGYVTTWKLGATYAPVEDVRLRVTRSRDIRAANRLELFAAGRFVGNTYIDPFRNNEPVNVNILTTGNLGLKPERADTTGIGVVLQPSWFQGFSASVDYYDIDIKDAIGTVGGQAVIDRCYRGEQNFCVALERNSPVPGQTLGTLSLVRVQPTNFVTQIAKGIDFEASYRTPMESLLSGANGNLTLRALVTHFITNRTDTGILIETAGQNYGAFTGSGVPNWRYIVTASYDTEAFGLVVTARGLSAGKFDNSFIECTTNCPVSTVANRTINRNRMSGALYFDASVTYQLLSIAEHETDVHMYFNVDNIANKDPAVAPNGPGSVAFSHPPASPALYDTLGRVFRAGLRFRM